MLRAVMITKIKAISRPKRRKPKPRMIEIGGVEVALHPDRRKGNIPIALIRRAVQEAVARRKTAPAPEK